MDIESPFLFNDELKYEFDDINIMQVNHSKNFDNHRSETNENFRISVNGIPNTGAKSRVETQIKLSISLLSNNDGEKVPYWSYLRIPDHLLAGSKLRKSQQQRLLDGTAAAMVSDESKVLDLDARVVCESDETKRIKMCQGCVRRERKRAERKKDAKSTLQELNVAFMDEKFERDRQRVLLFNCDPLIGFSSGEAILPTRITCYCRHHNERIGFRVRFTIRNKKGDIVATGDSPPIMITDDHKTTKPRTPAIRTRRRKPSPLMTPISSRKTSICESDTDSFFPVVDPIQTPYDSPKTPTFFDFPTLEKSIPILNHVFPTNGPCTGGIRITITGDHLHPGLTLMFGHRAAKTLSCTSNMMLCLLPMAETSGPVVLSFKEHPLMRASPIPPLFEYCESGRLDLLQLAIQTVPSMEHTDDMELDLVRVFSTFCGSASTTNLMGQTMLHFAAHLNYPRLMSVLVAKHPSLVDAQDVNGLSPLHMACNSKSTVVIEILLKAGADIGLFSNYGTPIQVALELLSTEEYHDFEKRLANIHTLNPFTVSWLPDLFVYACFHYNQRHILQPCMDFLL